MTLSGRHGIWPIVNKKMDRVFVAGGGNISGYSGVDNFEVLALKPQSLASRSLSGAVNSGSGDTAAMSTWLTVEPSQDRCAYVDGIDLTGHDLKGQIAIHVKTAADCEPSCKVTTGCSFFTFAAGKCYLKSSDAGAREVSEATSAKCSPGGRVDAHVTLLKSIAKWKEPSSGCVYVHDLDLHGSDLPIKPVAAKNAGDCEPLCRATARCTYFTFTRGRCFLKFASGRAMVYGSSVSARCRWIDDNTAQDLIQPPQVHPYSIRNGAFRQSCQALHWPIRNGFCSASNLRIGKSSRPKCQSSADFSEAAITCQRAGARLCTVAEVQSTTVAEDDCSFGGHFLWTSDACDGGFMVTMSPLTSPGAATKSSDTTISECRHPHENRGDRPGHIQCCADAEYFSEEPAGESSNRRVSCNSGSEWSIGGASKQLCTDIEPFASKCVWRDGGCYDAILAGDSPGAEILTPSAAQDHDVGTTALIPQIQQWSWGPDLPVALLESQGLAYGSRLWVFGGFENGYKKMSNRAFALSTSSHSWVEHPKVPVAGGISLKNVTVGQTDVRGGFVYMKFSFRIDGWNWLPF